MQLRNIKRGAILRIVGLITAQGRWFSPSLPVSSTNKTDRHDITETLLKVALSTIKQTNISLIAPLLATTLGLFNK